MRFHPAWSWITLFEQFSRNWKEIKGYNHPMALPVTIESSAKRLFPNLSPEQAIVELLLERAQKNLIKYRAMAREFERKYARDFESFRKEILASRPASEAEQDYFDWELAVTGIADMKMEIKRLKALQKKP
jgi:hypothetical protein